MTVPTHLPMSPKVAAETANVSRRTIMRALSSFELKGSRDNRNRWLIRHDDLDKWISQRTVPSERAQLDAQLNHNVELASLRTEVRLLKERLVDLEGDRDAWRSMAERNSAPSWLRKLQGWLGP